MDGILLPDKKQEIKELFKKVSLKKICEERNIPRQRVYQALKIRKPGPQTLKALADAVEEARRQISETQQIIESM